MDFTQASVRGQFERPDHVLERARPQLDHARQIWSGLAEKASASCRSARSESVSESYRARCQCGGLPERSPTHRAALPARLPRARCRRQTSRLVSGACSACWALPSVSQEALRFWLPQWEETFAALPEAQRPVRLQPARRAYYLHAFRSFVDGEQPQAVLWPLLRTWTQAVCAAACRRLPPGRLECACQELGLLDDAFSERVAALDAFLDMVDETLDDWARRNGV